MIKASWRKINTQLKIWINYLFFKASDKNGVRDENEDFNALCRGETISASVDHQANNILNIAANPCVCVWVCLCVCMCV